MVRLWIALAITTSIALVACGKNARYIMPSGAECKRASIDVDIKWFYDCDDGLRYIDPPTYKVVYR